MSASETRIARTGTIDSAAETPPSHAGANALRDARPDHRRCRNNGPQYRTHLSSLGSFPTIPPLGNDLARDLDRIRCNGRPGEVGVIDAPRGTAPEPREPFLRVPADRHRHSNGPPRVPKPTVVAPGDRKSWKRGFAVVHPRPSLRTVFPRRQICEFRTTDIFTPVRRRENLPNYRIVPRATAETS